MGLRGPELLIIIIVAVLPLVSVVFAYKLAKRKGYGQMVAAASVVIALVLMYFSPLLGLLPYIFFLLAPEKTS